MRRCVPLVLLVAGSCGGSDPLDARLKPLVGSSQAALVAAMGRPPDGLAEGATDVVNLQWYWRRTRAIAPSLLAYSYAGGTIRPIPLSASGIVHDECLLDWTVQRGIATAYRWRGAARGLAAAEVGSPARRD